jgi:hypothetical protein
MPKIKLKLIINKTKQIEDVGHYTYDSVGHGCIRILHGVNI